MAAQLEKKNFDTWKEEFVHPDRRMYGYIDMLSPKLNMSTHPEWDVLETVVKNTTVDQLKKLVDEELDSIYVRFFKKGVIDLDYLYGKEVAYLLHQGPHTVLVSSKDKEGTNNKYEVYIDIFY